MCSELIANDKPLLVHFNDRWYVPVLANYSESDFGGLCHAGGVSGSVASRTD
jgi:ABC-type microcin C transport system permease subunit YejE